MNILATSAGFQPDGRYGLQVGPVVRHAIALSEASRPRLCLMHTATGDDAARYALAYAALARDCPQVQVSHLQLFPMPNVADPAAHLLEPGRRVGGRRQCREPARGVAGPRPCRGVPGGLESKAWSSPAAAPAPCAGTSAARPTRSAPTCGRSPTASRCCRSATVPTTTRRSSAGRSTATSCGVGRCPRAGHLMTASGCIFAARVRGCGQRSRRRLRVAGGARRRGRLRETRIDPRRLDDVVTPLARIGGCRRRRAERMAGPAAATADRRRLDVWTSSTSASSPTRRRGLCSGNSPRAGWPTRSRTRCCCSSTRASTPPAGGPSPASARWTGHRARRGPRRKDHLAWSRAARRLPDRGAAGPPGCGRSCTPDRGRPHRRLRGLGLATSGSAGRSGVWTR